MRVTQTVVRMAVSSVIVVVMPLRLAHAYIDPGAGSALLQLLFGGAAGLLLLLRLYFGKLKALFSRNKADGHKPQP